jgi:uncharacterized repeat protein (TIGR03803 family)
MHTGAERVLYSFQGSPGGNIPYAGLIAVSGALYGTTVMGGVIEQNCAPKSLAPGCGIVFKLSSSGSRNKVPYKFKGHPADGQYPASGVIAVKGALYGTTAWGGLYGFGTAFKLTPSRSGYAESLLYDFNRFPDGASPSASLVDVTGTLYGTTISGGDAVHTCKSNSVNKVRGCGVVFALKP